MVVNELFAVLGLEYDQAKFRAAYIAIDKLALGYAAVAAAAAAATFAFFKNINSVAELGFEVQRTADKLGITTDSLQELRFGAQTAGVDSEKLEIGMQFLATKLDHAAHGSFEASRGLAEMGVKGAMLHGKLKPLDVALSEIADKFKSLGPQAQRTAAARFGFGRAGAGLIPYLELGSEGMKEAARQAHKFGVVMDADLIQRSVQYRKNLLLLSQAFQGLKIAMFGPQVGARNFISTLTEWINKNRELIASGFTKFVEQAGYVVTMFWRALRLVYEVVRDIAAFLPDMTAPLIAIGAGLMLAFAPLTTFFTFLASELEDIWVYKHGGDSMIGRIIDNWGFLMGILKEKFGDFTTWVKKEFVDFGIWLQNWVRSLPLMHAILGDAPAGVPGVNGSTAPWKPPSGEEGMKNLLSRFIPTPPTWNQAGANMSAPGGAAVHVEFNGINPNDTHKVAGVIRDAVDDALTSHYQAAYSAVPNP